MATTTAQLHRSRCPACGGVLYTEVETCNDCGLSGQLLLQQQRSERDNAELMRWLDGLGGVSKDRVAE